MRRPPISSAGGGLIIFPTDTVYGIGCDPFNREAVKRLIKAKGERTRPLPVLVDSFLMAEKTIDLRGSAWHLAQRFWPGPLTIVGRQKLGFPEEVAKATGGVGVRIPDVELVRDLIARVGGRLVGTSANFTGGKSPAEVKEVPTVLIRNVDIVLDGGPTRIGKDSTVVSFVSGIPEILRVGALEAEAIRKVLGEEGKSADRFI